MYHIPLGLFIIYIAGNMTDDTSLLVMAGTGLLGLLIVIMGYIPAKRASKSMARYIKR